jgi:hypothetical protein
MRFGGRQRDSGRSDWGRVTFTRRQGCGSCRTSADSYLNLTQRRLDHRGRRVQKVAQEVIVSEGENRGLDPGEATADLRPSDFVAGVIDDRDQLDAAVRDLVEAGFDESTLGIRYGQAGIDAFTSRPRHWFTELVSDQSDYIDRYAEELRRGHHALRVPLSGPVDAQRALARQILSSHGAHHIVSAGRWSFETDADYQPMR